MHQRSFARLAAIAALAILPSSVFAATITPQKLLDRAMISTGQSSLNEQAMLNVAVIDRTVVKTDSLGNIKARVRWGHREVPTADKKHDTEGSLALEQLDMPDAAKKNPLLPPGLSSALGVEWKSIGDISYLRFNNIPASIIESLKAYVPTLESVVGKWVSLDTKDAASVGLNDQGLTNDVDFLRGKPFLKVVKVEAKTKDKNGVSVWRIRASVNPAFINTMMNDELKRLKKEKLLTKAKQAEVTATYNDLRQTLKQTVFVANVEELSGNLQRLEVSGALTSPQKKCAYNARSRKDVCKANGNMIFQYNGFITFLPSDPSPIVTPTDVTPFEKFLQDLLTPPEPTAEATSSTTPTM